MTKFKGLILRKNEELSEVEGSPHWTNRGVYAGQTAFPSSATNEGKDAEKERVEDEVMMQPSRFSVCFSTLCFRVFRSCQSLLLGFPNASFAILDECDRKITSTDSRYGCV